MKKYLLLAIALLVAQKSAQSMTKELTKKQIFYLKVFHDDVKFADVAKKYDSQLKDKNLLDLYVELLQADVDIMQKVQKEKNEDILESVNLSVTFENKGTIFYKNDFSQLDPIIKECNKQIAVLGQFKNNIMKLGENRTALLEPEHFREKISNRYQQFKELILKKMLQELQETNNERKG